MINPKYYNDIKTFPSQFKKSFQLAKDLKIAGDFNNIVVCGMGGSSYYTVILNDYLATLPTSKVYVHAVKTYSLPNFVNKKTLVILASYSGNTEETLSCAAEVVKKKIQAVVFTSGGKLEEFAKTHKMPFFRLPTGAQPRLSSGYFIAGVLSILNKVGLAANPEKELLRIAKTLPGGLDEEYAKELAKKLVKKVPIIYTTDNIKSAGEISKIKFNENAKIQCFTNYFPELNHNEMVGFTNLLMQPFFLIFKSKFSHSRNYKRIEVFTKLMHEKGLETEVITPKGKTPLEEILNVYYFIDYVTYYLAEEYGIDPEPVKMVEDFKKLLG